MEKWLARALREVRETIERSSLNHERRSYTMEEAARALSISDSTVRRMVRSGAIRSVRIGKRMVVPASEVTRLLTPKPIPQRNKAPKRVAPLQDELAAMRASVKRR